MKTLVVVCATLLSVVFPGAVLAQVVRPLPMTGPAQVRMKQLYPPPPLDQVQEQALRRSAPLPAPPLSQTPVERWVPERQVFAPELGRVVVVPGHYEKCIGDQLYSVPPLPAYDTSSGATFIIPGGDRPPYDLRQGP